MASRRQTSHTPVFEPIAIIGQACTLPGAANPEALWDISLHKRDCLTTFSNDYLINVVQNAYGTSLKQDGNHKGLSRIRGGCLPDFATQFNPEDFALPASELISLDLVFQLSLHTARAALIDAKYTISELPSLRAGAVFGNLSYPGKLFSEFSELTLLQQMGNHYFNAESLMKLAYACPDPRNAYMSGLPAHILANSLQLSLGAYTIDAACASALYAIKLACDQLHLGKADMMLAGAVNGVESSFLHVGFAALQALSPNGESRPLQQDANGLVPSVGAGFLVLKRLKDAIADQDIILSVIRGIGLSNDGSQGGFLLPDQGQQVVAMQRAYAAAQLSPENIDYIECHATGTPFGDKIELESIKTVFGSKQKLALAALKSNLGHLLGASGAAATIRATLALQKKVLPPTVYTAASIISDEDSRFCLLDQPNTWDDFFRTSAVNKNTGNHLRRAAINCFGFGGNNAHLILESWEDAAAIPLSNNPAAAYLSSAAANHEISLSDDVSNELKSKETNNAAREEDIAIIAIGVLTGNCHQLETFAQLILTGTSNVLTDDADPQSQSKFVLPHIALQADEIRFPPNDLQAAFGDQLTLLGLTVDALSSLHQQISPEKTAVFTGMQCHPDVARVSLRAKIASLLSQYQTAQHQPFPVDHESWLQEAQTAIGEKLTAADALGCMPNVVANRINQQFDFRGQSFSVSSEELSGIDALTIACHALRSKEIDLAIVGAADMCAEPVRKAAAAALLPLSHQNQSDAAVVLILQRLSTAKRNGEKIYAVLPAEFEKHCQPQVTWGNADQAWNLTPLLGYPHAAVGLLHVAAAALSLYYQQLPAWAKAHAMPWLTDKQGLRSAQVTINALGNRTQTVQLQSDRLGVNLQTPIKLSTPFTKMSRYYVYTAHNHAELLAQLQCAAGQENSNVAVGDSDVLQTRELNHINGKKSEKLNVVIVAKDLADFRSKIRWVKQRLQSEKFADEKIWDTSQGIYYWPQPVTGELAFVFPGSTLSYAGMGRELLSAMPSLLARLQHDFAIDPEVLTALYQTHVDTHHYSWGDKVKAQAKVNGDVETDIKTRPLTESELFSQMNGFDDLKAYSALCQVHAIFSQDYLNLQPDACIGISSGESNALFAMHVWQDNHAMHQEITEAGLYTHELAGQFNCAVSELSLPFEWKNWRLLADVNAVKAIIAKTPDVYLTIINTAADCIIGGEASACQQVIAHLNNPIAYPIRWPFICHCPLLSKIGEVWRHIHHRQVVHSSRQYPRFYSGVAGEIYELDSDRIADALLNQAIQTVDFPKVINQAWNDGVRIFLEHGPRGLCSGWIKTILGDKPHMAIAYDDSRRSSLEQVVHVIAQLTALGIEIPDNDFQGEIDAANMNNARSSATVKTAAKEKNVKVKMHYALHKKTIHLPPVPISMTMTEPMSDNFIPSIATTTEPVNQMSNETVPHLLTTLNQAHQEFLQVQTVAYQRYLNLQTLIAEQYALESQTLACEQDDSQMILSEKTVGPTATAVASACALTGAATITPASEFKSENLKSQALSVAVKPKPKFSREDLEGLSSGKISHYFGELFAQQDQYHRQVRMPEPPLLLADRVIKIEGEPGSLGLGSIWTETDVKENAWYLHAGHMTAGITVEAGQADLLLISWLGIDFHNKGERVYRLLGCELVYFNGLPKPGDTLCFDIHVDGYATQGDIRLFFFHYDCMVNGELRLQVRHGQAGFFNDQELKNSQGVLWDAATADYTETPRLDAPKLRSPYHSFTREQLIAFAHGDVTTCFGDEFYLTKTHTRTPTLCTEPMLFLHEITTFDIHGGPKGRGYMQAVQMVSPDDWYFAGHFKNDPCMPGTLMVEAGLQLAACYLTACGFTINKDGWRFEPVTDEKYVLRCRGQVLPSSKRVVYEIFVDELIAEPCPTVFIHLLGTVDGLKAFHSKMGLRLIPDFPLTSMQSYLLSEPDIKPVAEIDGFKFDYASLLAGAWGDPEHAFGRLCSDYPKTKRVARLPGPPYHFISRVLAIDSVVKQAKIGDSVVVEYDLPEKAWYFTQTGHHNIPFCVLMEIGLQPCGWLAVFTGNAQRSAQDLYFRNLEGTAKIHRVVTPQDRSIISEVTLTKLSYLGSTILIGFAVQCKTQSNELIYEMDTIFGFFPLESFAQQPGLPTSNEQTELLTKPSDFFVDLTTYPKAYFNPVLGLPIKPEGIAYSTLMLSRVTGWWPVVEKKNQFENDDGLDSENNPSSSGHSSKILCQLRAEKQVDPDDWYFKAHFFQDPVQPGSLGVEALVQLLQFYMLHKTWPLTISEPVFEPILDDLITWKYRGQVVPENKTVTLLLDVIEEVIEEDSVTVKANGTLWVDHKCIYSVQNLSQKIRTCLHSR